MFFPFVKDIASKDVISMPINKTIGDAIQVMIESNHRAIVILDGHFHHILLAQDILTLNENKLDLNQPVSSAIIHKPPHIHQEKTY